MGFRTVVILDNDAIHNWENDPDLGKKIIAAQSLNGFLPGSIGRVVEVKHSSVVTLAKIEGHTLEPIIRDTFDPAFNSEAVNLSIIRQAAEQMGYSLRKKSIK